MLKKFYFKKGKYNDNKIEKVEIENVEETQKGFLLYLETKYKIRNIIIKDDFSKKEKKQIANFLNEKLKETVDALVLIDWLGLFFNDIEMNLIFSKNQKVDLVILRNTKR